MTKYIISRLFIAILTIFVLATATFFLARFIPGDPFAGPQMPPETKERLRIHFGLDEPLSFVVISDIL